MYCLVYFSLIFQINKLWRTSCRKSKIWIFFAIVYQKLKPESLAGCGRQILKLQVRTWKNKVFGNNSCGPPPGPPLLENRDSPSSPKDFLSVTPAFWGCFPGYCCTGWGSDLSSSSFQARGKWKMKVFSFLQNGYVRGHTYSHHCTELCCWWEALGKLPLMAFDFVWNASSFRILLLWSVRAGCWC